MLSSQSRKGRKLADRQNPVLSQDVVKLLKTQDAGYVTTILQKTKRARARLEQGFVLSEGHGVDVPIGLPSQKKGSHTVFVTSTEEQRQYMIDGDVASRPESAPRKPEHSSINEVEDNSNGKALVDLPREAPKSCTAAKRQELALKQDQFQRKQRTKEQDARRSKLAALKAREKDLIEAENELNLQRDKMSNSVGGNTRAGAKWKVRERKK